MVSSVSAKESVSGFPPIPNNDSVNKRGRQFLRFVNFYVGNSQNWNQNDIKSIDSALAVVMSDKNLNNVMLQYYPGHDAITSTFRGSGLLPGNYPNRFFKDDLQHLARDLFSQKKLDAYDLDNTVINLCCLAEQCLTPPSGEMAPPPRETLQEKEDSSQGLGGFHSSIHIPGNVPVTIYYAVGVYSEILPNQQRNGIVAFDKPWKNVVVN